jgi:hypothetical protein
VNELNESDVFTERVKMTIRSTIEDNQVPDIIQHADKLEAQFDLKHNDESWNLVLLFYCEHESLRQGSDQAAAVQTRQQAKEEARSRHL